MQSYEVIATDRNQRIADRESKAKDAMDARYAEIAEFNRVKGTARRKVRNRYHRLASMLEFADAFRIDIDSAVMADESSEAQDLPSVDCLTTDLADVTQSDPDRAERLERISARIMRREARAHAEASKGRSWTSASILSARGLKIAEALLRLEGGLKTSVEFGNTEGDRSLDRNRLIRKIHAERHA